MRPTHSCGEVSDGSSSSHGIAHAGRPFTAAKPRSTGEWPTVRLMQERATSFGSSRSKSVRSCGGPRTQPQVASENGALTFAAAAERAPEVLDGRLHLFVLHAVPGPALGRPEPEVVERVRLRDAPEHPLVEELRSSRGRPRSCPAFASRSLERFRHDERRLGADAGLRPEPSREGEGVVQDVGGAGEERARVLGVPRLRREVLHHVVAVVAAVEEPRRAVRVVARRLHLVAPVAAQRA